jgi:hypothetical protein
MRAKIDSSQDLSRTGSVLRRGSGRDARRLQNPYNETRLRQMTESLFAPVFDSRVHFFTGA